MSLQLEIRGYVRAGEKRKRYTAHLREYDEAVGTHDVLVELPTPALKPCPFSGSTALMLCNTSSAYYSVQCEEMAVEVHGPRSHGHEFTSIAACKKAHRAAIADAVEAWNRRA